MSDMQEIDYDSFEAKLVPALRSAWQEVRKDRPDETFYMYGIETDSDAVTLTPFCNSVEQFAAEHGEPEYPIKKWAVDQESELYGAGRAHTSELQDEVNGFLTEDESDDAYQARKTRLLETFETALIQLDLEGLFGVDEARNNVILMIDIGDADDDEWDYMIGALSRLNPEESISEYLELLEEAMEEFGDEEFDENWDDGE